MATIRIDLTEEQLRNVVEVVGLYVSMHNLTEDSTTYQAERVLDSALLAFENES